MIQAPTVNYYISTSLKSLSRGIFLLNTMKSNSINSVMTNSSPPDLRRYWLSRKGTTRITAKFYGTDLLFVVILERGKSCLITE